MTSSTQIFKPYSIITVPFPFTDKDFTKKRPALVISQESYQKFTRHCVLAMITSAKHSQWKLDIPIQDIQVAGLPGLSIIRPKLFTLDERLILRELGTLSERDKEAVKNMLGQIFVSLGA